MANDNDVIIKSGSASELEESINDALPPAAVQEVLGTSIAYGNDKNRGSVMFRGNRDYYTCKVKVWAKQKGADLVSAMEAFIDGELGNDSVTGLDLDYSNSRWRVILSTLNNGQGASSYTVSKFVDSNADELEQKVEDAMKDQQLVAYAYSYGDQKHRAVVIVTP